MRSLGWLCKLAWIPVSKYQNKLLEDGKNGIFYFSNPLPSKWKSVPTQLPQGTLCALALGCCSIFITTLAACYKFTTGPFHRHMADQNTSMKSAHRHLHCRRGRVRKKQQVQLFECCRCIFLKNAINVNIKKMHVQFSPKTANTFLGWTRPRGTRNEGKRAPEILPRNGAKKKCSCSFSVFSGMAKAFSLKAQPRRCWL